MGQGLNSSSRPASGRIWLYALAGVPIFTDLVETGRWPVLPREWLTEVVAGLVIIALVSRVHREHLALLALARHDPLTGLLNRGAFEESIDFECARARRSGQPLCLAFIDLDRFKQLNDSAGHRAGDLMLQQFAAELSGAVRAKIDRSFRVGGDEFALLLPGADAEQAATVIERVREHCLAAFPAWSTGTVGMSVGIVAFEPPESASDFVHRADAAMYRRKLAQRVAAGSHNQ